MTTVTQAVTLRCMINGHPVPVDYDVMFVYDPEVDPYAVTMAFLNTSTDTITEWLISRDLLKAAVDARGFEKHGSGDVVAWTWPARVQILLRSPDGFLVTTIHRGLLRAFLQRTDGACKFGTESAHVDVDAFIHQIFEETA